MPKTSEMTGPAARGSVLRRLIRPGNRSFLPKRRSVAVVISCGLAVLIFCLVLVSVLGLVGFFSIQKSLNGFSERSIPLIIEGSWLAESTNELMFEVERLVGSSSEADRRIAYSNVENRFAILKDLLKTEALSASGLTDVLRTLEKTVAELNGLVSSRIETGQRTGIFHAALLKYPETAVRLVAEIRELNGGEANSEAFTLWTRKAMGILSLCGDAASMNNLSQIEKIGGSLRYEMDELEKLSALCSETIRKRVSGFETVLERNIFGKDGMLALLNEGAIIAREEAGKSNFARSLARDFRTASQTLFNDFVNAAAKNTRSISQMVMRVILIFIVVFLVASLAFVLVSVYFRTHLTQRLVSLNNAILRKVAGAEISLVAEGNDEITDMTHSFIFYVDEVDKREKALLDLATGDPLTGISNRRHFLESGRAELMRADRYKRPAAFLMMDIDHFKSVNDTWGHPAGDAVLKSIVDTCRSRIREIDLFGRIGGEEFAFLLPDTNLSGGLEVAERIRSAIEGCVCVTGNHSLSCTVSIGLASSDDQGYSIDELMKAADRALYAAKASGRNCARSCT